MDLGKELKKIQEGFVRNMPSPIASTVGEGIKQLVLDKTGINDVGEALVNLYHAMHNLKEHNGLDSNELPVPATYVIEQNLAISYAFVDPDYTHRAEPADILAVLHK